MNTNPKTPPILALLALAGIAAVAPAFGAAPGVSPLEPVITVPGMPPRH